MHDPPRAAWTEVHLTARHLVAPRAPPVRHVLARGMRLEHQVARGVEDPGHDDLPVRRRRHRHLVATACAHRPSPFLVPGSPPGTRPTGRSSPPRSGGTLGSTRRPPSAAPLRAGPAATDAPVPARSDPPAPAPSGASRPPVGSSRTVLPARSLWPAPPPSVRGLPAAWGRRGPRPSGQAGRSRYSFTLSVK